MGCMQSTPVANPAAAPASNKDVVEATPAVEVAAEAPVAAEPEKEATPAADATPVSSETKLVVNGFSVTENGVVYYHVEAIDGSIAVKRRYNDFKALYAKLDSSKLPALPPRAFFRGRQNQQVIAAREAQFASIINAIATDKALAESEAFRAFLA
ncbi:hypothetical protein P43SY_006714 [Pythium insidiosum]|uniref:PX domain-containing protein n=1 Tax=Pythium insidiosum TaxID=114742 RepID=A0AAD5LQG3_PYTIN|nr:hypothetical protein P43SY_006714 [Pythium insidiosum]